MNKELIGKKIHYKGLVEFTGVIVAVVYDHYKIKVKEWLGKGYPHLIFYLTEDMIIKNGTLN